MQPNPARRRNAAAAIGLGIGAIFGMAGTFVPQASLRQLFWGIDGVALVVATCLLSLRSFRRGCDAVAAGFLVFALGESVMLAGTPAGLAASVPSYGAGIALWAAGLLLISFPPEFAAWTRAAGLLAAILFAIPACQIFWGRAVSPLARPLPYFGYPVLVLTFVGWMVALLRHGPAPEPPGE